MTDSRRLWWRLGVVISNLGHKELLVEHLDALNRLPKLGSIPPEIPDLPYRQLHIPPCRVFCRVETSDVCLLHVMRAEQLMRGSILDERFADV